MQRVCSLHQRLSPVFRQNTGETGPYLGDLRRAATEPGFAAGVLDYICSDEPTLLALAEHAKLPPEQIAAAQMLLSGPPVED